MFIVTAVYQMQQHVLKSGRVCHAVMEGTKDALLKIMRCKNDPNCMIHTLTRVRERERAAVAVETQNNNNTDQSAP